MASFNSNLWGRLDRSGILLLIARLVIGATFVWMGANKIGDPIHFLKSVRMYGLLPDTPGVYLNTTAIVLPWAEVVAGAALLIGIQVRGAALTIAMMLVVFTPAVLVKSVAIMHEKSQSFFEVAFDCGCGTGVEIIWRKTIMNVSLFVLSIVALLSRSRRFCLTLWFERHKPGAEFCHFCGYGMTHSQAGLCDSCVQPPTISEAATPTTG